MSYAAAQATAKRLLGRKGTVVTVTRKGQGAVDEIAGTRAAGGDKSASFSAVGLPPGRSAEFVLGTLEGRRLMMFYLVRLTGVIDPEPGDLVPWKGKTYTVVWSATYDPDASGSILTQAYGELAP